MDSTAPEFNALDFSFLAEYGAILLLILLNGFFAGSEIAMISVRKTRLDALIDQGDRRALRLKRLREDPDQFFATLQIGLTVVSVLASTLGGASVVRSLTPVLQKVSWLAPHAESIALAFVVTMISYLSLVVGELMPKSLGLRYAEQWALLAIWPVDMLSRVSGPVVRFLTGSSNLLLKPFQDETSFAESHLSKEELQALVEDSTRSGVIQPSHGKILNRAIEFSELRVRDIAVPYTEMVTLDIDAPQAEIRRVLATSGHSRLPVTKGSRDNVIGWISARDVLKQLLSPPGPGEAVDAGVQDPFSQAPLVLQQLLHEPFFVPASTRVEGLLQALQLRHLHLAIVVDEFGGVQGMATMEDILEKLVGEIPDGRRSAPRWMRVSEAQVLVPASMTLSDLASLLELPVITRPHVHTVGGLLLHQLERIPEIDEVIEVDGLGIRVLERSERRVERVEVTRLARFEEMQADENRAEEAPPDDEKGDEGPSGPQPPEGDGEEKGDGTQRRVGLAATRSYS